MRCDLNQCYYLSNVNGRTPYAGVFLHYKMKHRNTIAFIGGGRKEAEAAFRFLLKADCHLLLPAAGQAELQRISKALKNEKPFAGISMVDCIREGCWEADVVILAVNEEEEFEVARRMKDVVTQKIVISIKIADTIPGKTLRRLLPNAKIVEAILVTDEYGTAKLVISAGSPDALAEAEELLSQSNILNSIAA